MWHGYIVLAKPDGISSQEWDRALQRACVDLDESPNDPQPACRLHTVAQGDKTIIESTFDPAKLHTDYLRGLMVMLPGFMPFDKGDRWLQSNCLTRQYMAESWDWNTMPRLYFPEDYGAIGDGITDDTAAIQLAIDRAGDGGNVVLSRSYAISTAGIRDFQQYTNTNYALFVNADNVHIWGPGRLVLNELPQVDYGSFVALAVGNGDTPIRNVGVCGVTVDASALSESDLSAMSQAGVGCSIGFFNCRDFRCEGNIVRTGWGYNGAIQTHIFTEHGSIVGNRVVGSVKSGLWLDGLRYVDVCHNRIKDVGDHGIYVAINGDNNRASRAVKMIGNEIRDTGQLGFGITGTEHVVCDNLIESGIGIGSIRLIGAVGYPCEHCLVAGNVVRWTVAASGVGLYLIGQDGGLAERNFLQGNLVQGFVYGASLDQYTQYNVLINNRFDVSAGNPIYIFDKPGIVGNVTTPNY